MLKRCFDVVLAMAGVFFFAPVFVLALYAIWLCDGWPLFYLQERLGRCGHPFTVYKLRTMHYRRAQTRLPYLLRRSALDELPQLFNILKGDMSFVGPRPLIRAEVALLQEAAVRASVRPGLTGAAQLYAAKDAPFQKKVECDIWYVRNRTFWLDLLLILQSVHVSVMRRWDSAVAVLSRHD